MWLKLTAILLGFTLLFSRVGNVLADGPSTQDAVHMTGAAAIQGSQQQPQLLFQADATDGSGWHLEAVLSPVTTRSRNQSSGIGLNGRFTLSRSGGSTITGRASGQLSRYGDGSLQLTDQEGEGEFDASFSTDDSGVLQLDLDGQFPPGSGSQSASAADAQPVNHIFWYLSRALGLGAYSVLFLNVCLGLLFSARFSGPMLARWQSFDLHQFTGFLALGLTALHVFVLLGDQYFKYTVTQLLVPFAVSYRPFWTALGVISLYLLVIAVMSYYLRRWISYPVWRGLHYTTYGLFLMAFGHSVMSGTDTGAAWATLLYWGTGAVVAALTLWRFSNPNPERSSQVRGESASRAQAV